MTMTISVSWDYAAGRPEHERLQPAQVTYDPDKQELHWRLPFPLSPDPEARRPSPERQLAWASDILLRLARVGIAGRAENLPNPNPELQ